MALERQPGTLDTSPSKSSPSTRNPDTITETRPTAWPLKQRRQPRHHRLCNCTRLRRNHRRSGSPDLHWRFIGAHHLSLHERALHSRTFPALSGTGFAGHILRGAPLYFNDDGGAHMTALSGCTFPALGSANASAIGGRHISTGGHDLLAHHSLGHIAAHGP
ncbi:hypothetical protein C2845_PM01G20580 [Panicum miliaceum]|uniref:Uncharacterized protein n=1 Tax=Panicum miliaceum TaxID=4540 RepID=A0A3L6TJ45_PANMI|nr:hypothetical protein C2845_PM01G20580 [Panicum miliaceum]